MRVIHVCVYACSMCVWVVCMGVFRVCGVCDVYACAKLTGHIYACTRARVCEIRVSARALVYVYVYLCVFV